MIWLAHCECEIIMCRISKGINAWIKENKNREKEQKKKRKEGKISHGKISESTDTSKIVCQEEKEMNKQNTGRICFCKTHLISDLL